MIIDSRPLSYVSTGDIGEPLKPSCLLIRHRLLSLPDLLHACVEIIRNFNVLQEGLSKKAEHLGKIMEHFWNWWRAKYLIQLRECHRYSIGAKSMPQHGLYKSDIELVHNEKHLQGFWKLATIERFLKGPDKQIRGAVIEYLQDFKYCLEETTEPLNLLEIACQVDNQKTGDDRSCNVRDAQVEGGTNTS